jgi:hypothetical protein
MANALLSPSAKQQFTKNDGSLASSCLLYTYASGTTTPQATYSDRAGQVPNTNPITLDARGEATIYLTAGVNYRYVLKDSLGATIWTRDDVAAQAGDTNAVYYADPIPSAAAYLKTTSDVINGLPVSILRWIDNTKHAAILDGTSTYDVRARLQAAADEGLAVAVMLPRGKIVCDGTVTVQTARAAFIGEMAGTNGTRVYQQSNAPTFKFLNEGTLRNFGLIGTNNALHTAQMGVLIDGTNGVDLDGMVFDANYDSIGIKDVSHYLTFTRLRMFSAIKRHVYGYGTGAAGHQFDFTNSLISPMSGETPIQLANLGSMTMTKVVITPALMSERCLHIISTSSLQGLSQVTNCVFEGSTKEALRIEGSAGAPVKHFHSTNNYYNQSGSGQDAITLGYVKGFFSTNDYISGTGAGVTIYGDTDALKFTNPNLQVSGSVPVFRLLAGGKVANLEIDQPWYSGAQPLVDVSAATTPATDIGTISVRGDQVGSNATPLKAPSAGLISSDKWQSFTPGAPVPGSGAFTTATATGRYRRLGKTIQIQVEVNVTANNTAAGSITVNLPIAAAQPAIIHGRERNAFGYACTGTITSGGTTVLIKKYDDSYPGGSGAIITLSGSYEVA